MTTGTGLWYEARASLFTTLRDLTGIADPPSRRTLPAFALLGGLITVSDWIASSERHFPNGIPVSFTEEDIPAWFDQSRRCAYVQPTWKSRRPQVLSGKVGPTTANLGPPPIQ